MEDFPHYVTQINCLTGAIISETYIYWCGVASGAAWLGAAWLGCGVALGAAWLSW